MCGQDNLWSKICVDRLTYRQSKMVKDEIKDLLNLADFRQTDQKAEHGSSSTRV